MQNLCWSNPVWNVVFCSRVGTFNVWSGRLADGQGARRHPKTPWSHLLKSFLKSLRQERGRGLISVHGNNTKGQTLYTCRSWLSCLVLSDVEPVLIVDDSKQPLCLQNLVVLGQLSWSSLLLWFCVFCINAEIRIASYWDGIPLYDDANEYFLYIQSLSCVSMATNCVCVRQ